MTKVLGPELFWLVVYAIFNLIARVSHSPQTKMNSFWESTWWWTPLILIPLSYMMYFIPGVPKQLLWLRYLIVGSIGLHFALNYALGLHTEQGPGIGTAYMVGMGIGIFILLIGTVWALIKF